MIGSAPGLACATAIGAAPAMMITTAQAARMARVLAAPNARARRSGLSWRRQVRSFGAGLLAGARSLAGAGPHVAGAPVAAAAPAAPAVTPGRSEEHTSELQSLTNSGCPLLLG